MTIRFAATILAYVASLVAIGYTAMTVAPPGANPVTALIIPAVFAAAMLVCLVLGFLINTNRLLGMIGIHLALILPLVAAAGSISRLSGSINAANEFNDNLAAIQDAIADDDAPRGQRVVHLDIKTATAQGDSATAGDISNDDEDRYLHARTADGTDLFRSSEAAGWRPKGYQSVSLLAVAALSLFAFVALVAQRPALPPKQPKQESDTPNEPADLTPTETV